MAKRRLGLLKINGGCDDSNRRGDVIFVHGLGDHPITAWYPNPEEIRDKVDTEQFWNQELHDLNFWLNWLGKHRPDLGIWSYGYEAMPFKESSGLSILPIVKGKIESYTGKASPIIDQASELLELLRQRDILIKPKIFVTHSLGGLIVKETLYLAHDDLNSNDEMREIIGQTKGVVFCATPHQGSELANFKELLAQIVRTFRLLEENVIISELRSDNTNTQLYKSGKWYSGNTKTYDIETKAFYETEETEIPAIGKRLVVDRFSSDPNVIGVRPTAVNGADHFSIVKPQSENDTVYIGVREFIDKYLPCQKKTEYSSMNINQEAIKLWEEKLKHLQIEEAKASDSEKRFTIKQAIKECQQKISELKGEKVQENIENEDEQKYQLERAKIPNPNYIELLGREQEIDRIKDALSDSKGKRLVGITGLGGNGKTSLAIEVARDFRAMGFRYVVWQTASTKFNSTRMTFDSILENIPKQLLASLKDDVSNMDSLLDLIGLKGEIREIKTRELLSSQRVLLILDNMETSESQNEIAARLSSVLGNSKVLFTSRNRFDTLEVDVWDYYLQGLQEEASIKLMKQVAQERDITFYSDNSGELLKFTGNNKTGYLPLALKLVTGQLKNKTIAEIEQSLYNVRLTEDDVQEDDMNVFKKFWWRIFFPSLNMLSPSDLDFMLFLALLKEQEGTTNDRLLSLTQQTLTEDQFFQAIDNTWRLCFLEREEYYEQRYYLHVLTSTFFNKILNYTRRIIQ